MTLSRHEPTFSCPDPFVNSSPLNWEPLDLRVRKKVAIVGFEEQFTKTAPLDDPDWDVWGFNMGNRLGIHADSQGRFRADRWFDLHQYHAQDHKDMAWIEACPVPIYLTHDFGSNPLRRVFDLEAVTKAFNERFGITEGAAPRYFASSFAYAFFMAMAEGYDEIGLFGVSLDYGRERLVERGNLEFWMGLAMGAGIQVTISPNSKLLTHPALYGIEYDQEKNAVAQLCAKVIRDILNDKTLTSAVHKDWSVRWETLTNMAEYCKRQVDRAVYQTATLVPTQEETKA